jgi:hypothetical protein
MTKQQKDILYSLGFALVIILLIVFGPFVIIWALNTLFPVLAINYGFWQWLAVVLLNLILRSSVSLRKED